MNDKRKYDSAVARIAGNILSGHRPLERIDCDGLLNDAEKRLARWAVNMARAIVAEVERTEPVSRLAAVEGVKKMNDQQSFDKVLLIIARAIESVAFDCEIDANRRGRLCDALRSVHSMQQDSRDGFLVLRRVTTIPAPSEPERR